MVRVNEICLRLRLFLEEAVKRNLAEGILLSGGLDSSALAVIASKFFSLKAFTVALRGAQAPDVEYATLVANNLQLKHHIHYFDQGELHNAIQKVVKTMRSFDPMEIRNSITIYIGLRIAREEGVSSVMTGDGCDELFSGYSFLFDLEKGQLDLELQKLWSVMAFSSVPLAKALGIEAKLPYLDSDFKSFAMKLDSLYKVRNERQRTWGKWILRKAFESVLPQEIVWRVKIPIERGSGTTILPNLFNQKISDDLQEHKDWVYRVCSEVGITPIEPLWGLNPKQILDDFIDEGFEAIIVNVKADLFGEGWLGRKVDGKFLEDLRKLQREHNFHICGESGEYHTFVIDGLIFKKRIKILDSERVLREGYWKYWLLEISRYDIE